MAPWSHYSLPTQARTRSCRGHAAAPALRLLQCFTSYPVPIVISKRSKPALQPSLVIVNKNFHPIANRAPNIPVHIPLGTSLARTIALVYHEIPLFEELKRLLAQDQQLQVGEHDFERPRARKVLDPPILVDLVRHLNRVDRLQSVLVFHAPKQHVGVVGAEGVERVHQGRGFEVNLAAHTDESGSTPGQLLGWIPRVTLDRLDFSRLWHTSAGTKSGIVFTLDVL
jgi:hypothetical protein